MEELKLTQEWDKTFAKSDKVEHSKVTFHNRYGITLAADVYKPRGADGELAAIAVCGPFGAVKEQASGLYAQAMAERGEGETIMLQRYPVAEDFDADFISAFDNACEAVAGVRNIRQQKICRQVVGSVFEGRESGRLENRTFYTEQWKRAVWDTEGCI